MTLALHGNGISRGIALGTVHVVHRNALDIVEYPVDESALPGFDNAAWHCLFAPANTPPAVISKLHSDVVRVLRMPATIERMAAEGVDVIGGTPAELAVYIKQDFAKYEKLIRAAGIKVD